MDYLIRFVQVHESFRKPEIEALAILANVDVEFLFYDEKVGSQISLVYFRRESCYSIAQSSEFCNNSLHCQS